MLGLYFDGPSYKLTHPMGKVEPAASPGDNKLTATTQHRPARPGLSTWTDGGGTHPTGRTCHHNPAATGRAPTLDA
jgi:hypothetical protein